MTIGHPADGNGLRDSWMIVARRRWVVYLCLIALTLVALVGSFLTTPQYKATATLQIERFNPDILTFRDLAQADYSWSAYDDFYKTQYRIISSTAVARLAVARAGLLNHPDVASAAGRPGLLARLRALVPSRGAAVDVEPEDVAAAMVQSRLEVVPVRNSHLVNVSWVAPDPRLAADVANAVAEAYVQFNIEAQYSTSDQAEEFLVNQIGELKNEIRRIEEELLQYGEARSIISIDATDNITLRALEDIAQRQTAAKTRLAEAAAHLAAVTEASPDALPEVLNSNLISKLREEHAGYEAEHSEKSRLFKNGWPGMQTLESKLRQSQERLDHETRRIASQVRAAAEADYGEALAEVRNYDSLLASQELAAQKVKRDAVEYANLQSEVQKRRETLNALIGRQNEMALSSRLKDVDSSTNIRIMERARPPAFPYRPRTGFNLLVSLVLGLGLGVGMALLLDYLDNTVGSPEDLKRVGDYPLLALIPRHGQRQPTMRRARRRQAEAVAQSFDLVTHADGQAAAAEAFRELRTSILLSHPGTPAQRIMITSANPEDGKTATAVNLAIVLAQLGRRVVLVDTDLRRPRIHVVFSIENGRGVSNYLSGLETDPLSLLRRSPVENLDVLTSGPIPPNPSELLNSAVFGELSHKLLSQGWDHVVFDSPPVLSVSDPVVIASVVDTGILVVRAGRTARQALRSAADKLAKSNVNHFGVVLNDVDLDAAGAPYDYYQHYVGERSPASRSKRRKGRTHDATA